MKLRSPWWVVLAAAAATIALAAGARLADALLCGLPPLTPLLWARARRRHDAVKVALQAAVLVVAAFLGALALGASLAAGMQAAMPWLSSLRFGCYLLAWLVALRLLQAALVVVAAKWVRPAALRSVLVAIVTIAVGLPNLYVALQTHRIAVAAVPTISVQVAVLREQAREVTFDTLDGVHLVGTLLTQPSAAASAEVPVVVVCHGLGANRAAFFAYAEMAWQLGCHALAFDFRAHGGSGGFTSTFGAEEVFDVAAAVGWVRSQPSFAQSPLVLVGVSMGAVTALRAAAIVGANGVLAESAFADLSAMVAHQVAPLGPFADVAAWSIGLAARWQLGVELDDVSPRRSLSELATQIPVVLLQSGADAIIPRAESERLAAVRQQAIHTFAGSPHGGCSVFDPERVMRLLEDLLAAVRAARHAIGNK